MRHAGRFWRMLRDVNFPGLWHQLRRVLGLRGSVPMPSMPEQDIRLRVCNSYNGFSSRNSVPRVLFFSHDLNFEGASLSLFELVSALQRKGVVHPEVVSFGDGPLRIRYEAAGISVTVFEWATDRLSTKKRLDAAVIALTGLIRQKCPDVVLANTLRSFLAILAAKEAEIPSVWSLHESAPWDTFFCYLPDPVAQRAISAICLPYRVVFVSHASRRIWDKFDRYGNFDVIHNKIDLSRFPEKGSAFARERANLGLKDSTVALLCVGTINARKGQRDLVEATALLPQVVLERVEVLLVGDDIDPYARKLKRRCHAFSPGIRKKIRFFPSTETVQRFYEAADIFVFCSREESFPRVILEAMAFGLPIITTPVHGVTEQCVEGKNAIFYTNGKVEDLAGKIVSLAQDKNLRKRMAESSLQLFSKHKNFEEMVDAYASVLRKATMKKN